MYTENTIFRKLADIREDLDMTQKTLADKMNVRQGVYSRWESGKEIIPLRRLNQFCNITGYSMDYVLCLTNYKQKTKPVKKLDLKKCGARLKDWRIRSGITQRELADYLNTSQSTISAYEVGKVLILTAFAYQIARKYNVSLDFLCGRWEQEKIQ